MKGLGLVGAGFLALLGVTRPAIAKPQPVTPPAPIVSQARVMSRAFSAAARAIGPSVVRLDVRVGDEDVTASGIIIDTVGNVVTSNHVLDGASAVTVVLVDDRRLETVVVGRDARTDVALLRMVQPPSDLSAARFGDSDIVAVGEWVLAVGSPLGLDQSTTAGIISGRSRAPRSPGTPSSSAFDLLQTDANLSAGSAGGPLVNLDGEVVGLSALSSAGPGGSYGYAVPINQVRRVAQMLARDGRAEHPYIGVALLDLADLDPAERARLGGGLPSQGAVVSRISKGAPAARAGLLPGDVITSINNQYIPAPAAVADFVSGQDVGAKLMVGFVRDGRERTLPVALGALPAADPKRD
ncbi:MAG TPA: trypsin-like peptidase domain-containing protein [Polyangia bacterium]|jgi:putative serine protease PepD|nr:trypsin-like peptidase domain-containing protein [Polyangia bacterium]